MDNSHRENVKKLFRWWNGKVFSFETAPGTKSKEDDGFDSGMDEAEAALNSNEELSGEGGEDLDEDFRDNISAPALQSNADSRPDIPINFMQLTISERTNSSEVPSNPVAAPVGAIAVTRVSESALALGDGTPNMDALDAQNVTVCFSLITP